MVHGMLEVALAQLDAVAERLKLDPGIHKRLRQPQRSLIVSVPTLMDDGRIQVLALSRKERVDLRTSALMLGVSRVAEAKRLRGLYP